MGFITNPSQIQNYIEEVEDSTLINIAYNYFMQQEDAQRRAMVLYYKVYCAKSRQTEEAQNSIWQQ